MQIIGACKGHFGIMELMHPPVSHTVLWPSTVKGAPTLCPMTAISVRLTAIHYLKIEIIFKKFQCKDGETVCFGFSDSHL